jgi:hypothetical protein
VKRPLFSRFTSTPVRNELKRFNSEKVTGNPQIGNNPFSNSEQVVDNPINML